MRPRDHDGDTAGEVKITCLVGITATLPFRITRCESGNTDHGCLVRAAWLCWKYDFYDGGLGVSGQDDMASQTNVSRMATLSH
jgi:hypothetical protein